MIKGLNLFLFVCQFQMMGGKPPYPLPPLPPYQPSGSVINSKLYHCMSAVLLEIRVCKVYMHVHVGIDAAATELWY